MIDYDPKKCTLCPRECRRDRSRGQGFCGEGDEMRIAKIMLHKWEEPCISGNDPARGSGAVFFSGCPLHCIYCQNRDISSGGAGSIYSPNDLSKAIRTLEDEGAYNINFVTPTHFYHKICEALDIYRPNIPIVFNTGGYEKAETVESILPYCDIFLTDIKYASEELSLAYSSCPDYFERAMEALEAMVKGVGKPRFFENGMMEKGVILRHLVLPGGRKDSERILRAVKEAVGCENVILSLMSQYTPDFAPADRKPLNRRITTFEYEYVRNVAAELGFSGYGQERMSATAAYTPDF